MGIQVHNHYAAHPEWFLLEQPDDEQRDVSIWTETTASVRATVMEPTAQVDGPTIIQCQLTGQNGTGCLKAHGSQIGTLNVSIRDEGHQRHFSDAGHIHAPAQ